jgi:hypothetical protein
MGFFKNINELNKIGKEASKNFDVGQTMSDAKARIANAQEMMARQTKAANMAASAEANGVDLEVSIIGMRQVGMMNFDPMMEFELTAFPEGRPPYPITTQQTISQMQLAHVQPGTTLHAKVDPGDPSAIWLDLSTVN